MGAVATQGATAGTSEHRSQPPPARQHCRRGPEQQTADERDEKREAERPQVDLERTADHGVWKKAIQELDASDRGHCAADASEETERDALSQHLPDQPPAAGAERRAN